MHGCCVTGDKDFNMWRRQLQRAQWQQGTVWFDLPPAMQLSSFLMTIHHGSRCIAFLNNGRFPFTGGCYPQIPGTPMKCGCHLQDSERCYVHCCVVWGEIWSLTCSNATVVVPNSAGWCQVSSKAQHLWSTRCHGRPCKSFLENRGLETFMLMNRFYCTTKSERLKELFQCRNVFQMFSLVCVLNCQSHWNFPSYMFGVNRIHFFFWQIIWSKQKKCLYGGIFKYSL